MSYDSFGRGTMIKPIILIVDDDDVHRSMLSALLKGWGYDTDEASDGDIAITKAKEHAYDVILSDLKMARVDGIKMLECILSYNPSIPIIIMTAWSSVETAVQALRMGAYDYLTKPLDFDALRKTLQKALTHLQIHPVVSSSESLHKANTKIDQSNLGILGRSPCMLELIHMVSTVAPSEATILIIGESGTGKELVARAIKQASHRNDAPFITVNCAALSPALLESELFGHEKGAFTGADRRREGRFKQADGGTLFLDEIGELPLLLQAKLLRAIQQGEIQRVGSDTSITVNVRVIAATNRDLPEEVIAGRFREDLYYRLNVIGIEVPPLRNRIEDIPLLATFFLEKFALSNRKVIKGFTSQSMDILLRYNWPGNVRELENAIERAVILTTGDYISERELPTVMTSPAQPIVLPIQSDKEITQHKDIFKHVSQEQTLTLEELEKRAIMNMLHETSENKSEAARRLGITRATLHNKLKRYGIE